MDAIPLFVERQAYKQVWVWILLLAVNGFLLYNLARQFFAEGRSYDGNTVATIVSCSVFVLVLATTILFFVMQLDSEIRADGIYYRFYPFHKQMRRIKMEEITEAYVRKYNPIVEYGGWGPKKGPSGQAYNVSGNWGIQLVLNNGHRVLLGTKNPEAARQALKQVMQVN